MKQILRLLCLLSPLIGLYDSTHALIRGHAFFYPRSQSAHAEREIIGWQDNINLATDGINYGAWYIMPLFSRSIRSEHIAEYFFDTNELTVSGSKSPTRGEDDLLADYFGLPLDYKSKLRFCPTIQNAVVDLNWYGGLDAWVRGMYVRVHSAIVHTNWNMRMHEERATIGSQSYPVGYMSSSAVNRGTMNLDAREYFRGEKQVGDIKPLHYGLIDCARRRNGLADINVALGWNFSDTIDHHFGLNLRTTIPTSHKSTGRFLFEPLIGNNGHWEFGLGLTGHTILWESDSSEHVFSFYADANMTHLFTNCQRRPFDFKINGHLSRYMLIQEIGNPIVQGLEVGSVTALQQYHGKLLPAVNVTTLDVAVSVALQFDIVAKLAYYYHGWSVDVGYDLWGRTSEQFKGRQCFPSNCYAIKGDALVYGTHSQTGRFVALNATQTEATINAGSGKGNADFSNSNADNSEANDVGLFATFEIDGDDELVVAPGSTVDVRGSQQAILLGNDDIDNLSALAPMAIAHTLFVHASYAWEKFENNTPFFGVGSEVTFDGGSKKRHATVSEWAVWAKVGLSY